MPVIFLTTYDRLVDMANLQENQTVFVCSTTGGVSQTVIWIVQHRGAKGFATVGSPSKRQELVESFGILEGQIFSNRYRRFKKGFLRVTRYEGVDVVLHSHSGTVFLDGVNCTAKFIKFI